MNRLTMTAVLAGCAALGAAQFASAQTSTDVQSSMGQDKVFLKHASEGGLAEIQMGQLATQKASSPDVKAFGQKMVDDHTTLNSQMMPFAQKAQVPPPAELNKKDQATYDKLNGLSGAAFDKAYMQAMVMDHKKDLGEFKSEERQTNDPDLKAAVKQGETVIAMHYQMAQQLEKQVGSGSTAGSTTPSAR